MNIRLKAARESRNISALQMAEELDVDRSTINNWEAGRRQIPIDKLVKVSDILGYSVDYLLGYDRGLVSLTEPIATESLFTFHGRPVWIASLGWVLVNIAEQCFVLHDMTRVLFRSIQGPIYAFPPAMTLSLHGVGEPLKREEVTEMNTVWVEVITVDAKLSEELRGWYQLFDERLVQNEFGCRFYLDTYGVKWLAFKECLP